MPEISIIVPVYNMESYLMGCIKSIQKQNFDDYEVIIIDDGSKDHSYDIAKELAERNTKIRAIHKDNEGVSIARNTGIELAKGSWIMFVDPDDTLEPVIISELLAYTDEQVDIVACCCNAFLDDINEVDYFFDKDKRISSEQDKKELYKQLLDKHCGQPGAVYTGIGVPWGKLYRRSFLEGRQLHFNPKLKRYQDNIFNMWAFAYARVVQYINKPLYNYRLEHVREYIKMYKPNSMEYMVDLCEERYKGMTQLNLMEDDELKMLYRKEMLRHYWSILKGDIFNSQNSIPYSEKKMQADSLQEKGCFRILFDNKGYGFTWKERVKWWLISRRLYGIIDIGFKLM